MQTYTVELGARSYPIHIGPDLLQQPALLRNSIRGDSAFVVTNTTVGPLYLEPVLAALSDLRVGHIALPDGEAYKSLATLDSIYDALLDQRFDRRTTLVALGGGVVGDITGFAAATYQRGVDFIQVPTTLLAQVDSSVGGKTGINHPRGKNMVGAFLQPRCVLADTGSLRTLDDRHLRSGLAEVVKYGLIRDLAFFEWLEANHQRLLARDAEALTHAIGRSCANKAEVVAADELEQGQRALLNLGHTFGHAIETAAGYGAWTHGEAVAAGTCMAARLSVRMGWMDPRELARTEALFRALGLPTVPPAEIPADRFMEIMAVDKKVRGGRIVLVLLQGIGRGIITADYDDQALRAELSG